MDVSNTQSLLVHSHIQLCLVGLVRRMSKLQKANSLMPTYLNAYVDSIICS